MLAVVAFVAAVVVDGVGVVAVDIAAVVLVDRNIVAVELAFVLELEDVSKECSRHDLARAV